MLEMDLTPLKTPPQALPTCIWNSIVLWKNQEISSAPLDLSSLALPEALHSIYEELSFLELANICAWFNNKGIETPRSELFQIFHFRLDGKTEKILELIPLLPESFILWAKSHRLSPADLYPLTASKDISALSPILTQIAEWRLSRAEGAQAIDWAVDAILMETDLSSITATDKTQWLETLKKKRFPQTTNRDQEKQEKLLSVWPKIFSPRWLRSGDRSGVEVRFVIGSKKELADKITALNRVYENIHD